MPGHPKINSLTDGAFRLHISALCYAQQYLTDGRVRRDVLRGLMPRYRPAYVQELLDHGLWEVDQGEYLIHDFTEFQKTRSHWDERKAKEADRMARWRASQNGKDHDV